MSIKKFKPTVVITSGGTTEPIDNVRVMSNVSTGATGCKLALTFLKENWNVVYIHGVGADRPSCHTNLQLIEVSSAKNAEQMIKLHSKDADAIIMAMAVSDFTFEQSNDVKLDSSDAKGFIEYLSKTITPNVKILPQLREVNPDAFIVGFKYTVGATFEERMNIAKRQIRYCSIDATFVNDDVEMREKGRCGNLVYLNGANTSFEGRDEIAKGIFKATKESVRHNVSQKINEFFR